jgi:hypothetical protein
MTETDEEIEARVRAEIGTLTTIRLRILGPYEVAALLRLLDKEREERSRK